MMDHHPSFWQWNLEDMYTKTEGEKRLLYSFTSPDDGNTYYSILVHVCEWTWAEFFSTDIGSVAASEFTPTNIPRMVFSDWNKPGNEYFYSSYDYPIALSRAVTDMDKVKEFY